MAATDLHLPPFKRFAPWSLSKSDTAAKCGSAFAYNYIHKLPRVTSEAAQVGVAAHRVQELMLQYVPPLAALAQTFEEMPELTSVERDKVRALLPAMQKFCVRILRLADTTPLVSIELEKKWAIDWDFKPVEWEDPTALFRGVLDVVIERQDGYVMIIDHKTGKRREVEYYTNQLDAYAVLVHAHLPHIKGAQGALHYVKTEDLDWHIMRRDNTILSLLRPWLKGLLEGRANSLGDFKPRVGPLCGWCDYRQHCDAYKVVLAAKEAKKKELAEEKKAEKALLKKMK